MSALGRWSRLEGHHQPPMSTLTWAKWYPITAKQANRKRQGRECLPKTLSWHSHWQIAQTILRHLGELNTTQGIKNEDNRMSFQIALRPFFPFFHVAVFLGGRKLLLLNWVCRLLVHSSSMITRDLSTGEGRDLLLSLRSVWLFSSYLLLWVSHSPLGRGGNCLHVGNLFIKQKFSQEKRETEREKKGVFFHWNIMSKDFCVRFLKHFTAIMLTACTVYGSGSQLFTANSVDCLIWIKSMLARILKSQATKLSCKTFSDIIDGRTAGGGGFCEVIFDG